MILRLAAPMAQLELFQAQDIGAGPPGQPVGRATAESAKAQGDVLEIGAHGSQGGRSRGSPPVWSPALRDGQHRKPYRFPGFPLERLKPNP